MVVDRVWQDVRRYARKKFSIGMHGVEKRVTVQKICRARSDEKDVRVVLDDIWKEPSKAREVMIEAVSMNQSLFEFEKTLIN